MFESADIVEEIETGRLGVLGLSSIGPKFEVRFSDGIKPLVKGFEDPNKLRLVERPSQTGSPRLIPKNWIV
jgi:hypothetical protein